MKVLLIDNYDSFTYNLYQYLGEVLLENNLAPTVTVKRNDEITVTDIREAAFDRIVLSPGPGDPSDRAYFGVCADVLTGVAKTIPTLGVCLGMQGMAHYYGGKVVRAKLPMHGKTSIITHDEKGVFTQLPQGLEVMRYHSLIADKKTLPHSLVITATVADNGGEIMGLRHKKYPVEGVQFHPESFASEGGKQMLRNFLFRSKP